MALNKSKLAAAVLGGLVLLWALALFVGMPWLHTQKVENLVGQPLTLVLEQLGPPTREWTAESFACASQFPCVAANARGGPVLLYSDGRSQAWYLYFDAHRKLTGTEASRPPRN
ncbi:MAG: hypothetical protein ACOZIN_13325 [Myxococcota bacterium]